MYFKKVAEHRNRPIIIETSSELPDDLDDGFTIANLNLSGENKMLLLQIKHIIDIY